MASSNIGSSEPKESLSPYLFGGLIVGFIGVLGITIYEFSKPRQVTSTNLFNWTDKNPITKDDLQAALQLMDEGKLRYGEELNRQKIRNLQIS